MNAILDTELPLPGRRSGKVRDVYDLPPTPAGVPRLLIVASDRLSAFDVVLPTPIPGKGSLLTRMSCRWFELIEKNGLATHHLLSTDPADVPGLLEDERSMLRGRIMITRKCHVVPVECVARGYLDGSGWKEYSQSGAVCGVELPAGLERGGKLPEPIFTPATKAEQGAHDENISFDRACDIAGERIMDRLREQTLAIYTAAHDYAEKRGVILADTKFEFGYPLDIDGARVSDDPILIDEALTPDSSRYWPADQWKPGGPQVSYDKQYVREHLEALTKAGKWDKTPPGPELPDEVVAGTIARYDEAYRRLFE